MSAPLFDYLKLEALCEALVADDRVLKHKDVEIILNNCKMPVPERTGNRKDRLMASFISNQNILMSSTKILQFVQMACDPARFIGNQELHEEYRARVNSALSMVGKAVGPDGKCVDVK